jgi:hypothetical protein
VGVIDMKLKTFIVDRSEIDGEYIFRLIWEDGKDYTLAGSVIGDIFYDAWAIGISPYELRELVQDMRKEYTNEQNIS